MTWVQALWRWGVRAVLAGVLTCPLAMAQGGVAPLVVVGDVAFPPYSYLEAGQPRGIDVELMQELSRRTGVPLQLSLQPFKRVIESLRSGSVDAAMAVLHSAEREAFALYAGVLHTSTYVLFVPRGAEFAFSGVESLRGKRIGKVRGFFISEAFEAEVAAGRIVLEEAASSDQTLRMLLAGRVDAFSGQSVVTRYYAREAGVLDKITALPQVLTPDRPSHLVLSRASAWPDKVRWAERFRQVLDAMHRDGTVARIEARFQR